MLLKTASYDDGVYAGLATETRFLSYSIVHEFNQPAIATIILADADGSMIQKYNTDADDVYVGAGQVHIEDPDLTVVFAGRIVRVERTDDGRCVLTARDWLSQLDETKIDYDMREELNLAGLRESQAATDPNNAVYVGPAYTNGADYYLYDNDMSWAVDQFNGMTLVLTAGMAGATTVSTGPYEKTTAPATDFDSDAPADTWGDDAVIDLTSDNDASFEVTYDFRVLVNASTGFFVTGSINAIRVVSSYLISGLGTLGTLWIYDHTGAAFIELDDSLHVGWGAYNKVSYTVPEYYNTRILDANGIAHVKFIITWPGGGVTSALSVDYLHVEVDCSTTGYSTAIAITDTERLLDGQPRLKVGTDLTAAATKIWEGVPYSIARPIYKHIDHDEAPGHLVMNGATLFTEAMGFGCGGVTVEHTTGISTRHYSDRTRLQIMRDLAKMDKAVFWIPLGGASVYWKSTFNAAGTAMTDATVLSWDKAKYDYDPMRNSYKVMGIRIGESQISATSTSAASVTDYGATRSEVVTDSGVVSLRDATTLAAGLVAKDKDPIYMLEAILAGLSATTFRLASEVLITSTVLGLTGAKAATPYVVIGMAYDSTAYRTRLTLLPRANLSTIGLPEQSGFGETLKKTIERGNDTRTDLYMPRLTTETWTNP